MRYLPPFVRLVALSAMLMSCMMPEPMPQKSFPAVEYSNKVRNEHSRLDTDEVAFRSEPRGVSHPVAMRDFDSPYPPDSRGLNMRGRSPRQDAGMQQQYGGMRNPNPRAQMRLVKDGAGGMEYFGEPKFAEGGADGQEMVTNMGSARGQSDYQVYRSTEQRGVPYRGPLTLGDPGATASLWQESRGSNNLYRDFRAWQPMDVITILVEENSEGRKEADTEVTEESSILAGITNLFNFEADVEASNSGLDTANLVSAATTNEFTGEGETSRRGSLTGKISAMVVEILPSGVMRIEGEKIVSVNNEEQVMIISGLVRRRDINFRNEVSSGNVANLRVDYYGKGIIGEAQDGGWLSRFMRIVWPF